MNWGRGEGTFQEEGSAGAKAGKRETTCVINRRTLRESWSEGGSERKEKEDSG